MIGMATPAAQAPPPSIAQRLQLSPGQFRQTLRDKKAPLKSMFFSSWLVSTQPKNMSQIGSSPQGSGLK